MGTRRDCGRYRKLYYSEAWWPTCESCAIGKAKQAPFPKCSKPKQWELLERINVDECGPLPVRSLNGERYFITFSDQRSKSKFTFLLHRKNEAFEKFRLLKLKLENRIGKRIKILFGDNDSVFVDKSFQTFLAENGIEWQATVPYSSEQNGISELGHLI